MSHKRQTAIRHIQQKRIVVCLFLLYVKVLTTLRICIPPIRKCLGFHLHLSSTGLT